MKIYKFQEDLAQRVAKGEHVHVPTGCGKRVVLQRALEILEQQGNIQNISKPNPNWIPCGEKAFSSYDSTTHTLYYLKASSLEEVIAKKLANKLKNAQREVEDFLGVNKQKKEQQMPPQTSDTANCCNSAQPPPPTGRHSIMEMSNYGFMSVDHEQYLIIVNGLMTALNLSHDEHRLKDSTLAQKDAELGSLRRENINLHTRFSEQMNDLRSKQADLDVLSRNLTARVESHKANMKEIDKLKRQVARWKGRAKKLSAKQ